MKSDPKGMAVGARLAVRKLRRACLDVEGILKRAGLTLRAVNKEDGWVSDVGMGTLFEIAAEELDDPYLGLHLAEEENIRDYGAIAYIGISSETLGDAIQNLARYVRTVTEGWEITLTVEDENAVVEYTPTLAKLQDYRHMVEGNACSIMIFYQTFLGESLLPKEIHFSHSFDGDKKEHEIVFGCPVKFGENRNRIILDRKELRRPIKTADEKLLRTLKNLCDQVYRKHASKTSGLASRIQKTIMELLPRGQAHAKEIAGELGMSERTMHRRLVEEGYSFSELMENLKQDLAEKYMKQIDLKISDVAFLLGYSDHSAFSTAFKRWTGKTPREARQS
jgi:AraC-like DNA-binding protein